MYVCISLSARLVFLTIFPIFFFMITPFEREERYSLQLRTYVIG